MIDFFPTSKNNGNSSRENFTFTQSVTIDIRAAINTTTLRSILSFCKQWNIRNIYIKLPNLDDTSIIDNLNAAIGDTFLFSPDEFQFYLYFENLEKSALKIMWKNNKDAKDFLLPFLINTADYEVHDKSMGEDIVRFFNPKPECYLIKPEKNTIYLKLKFPEHVFAIILESTGTNKNKISDFQDVTDHYDLKTGVLKIPWKNKNEVKVHVIRKIYGWSDSSVNQKINIFSSKIFESFLNYQENHLKHNFSFFSGFILNSDSFYPDNQNITPIDPNISEIYLEQTNNSYTKSMIQTLHDKNDQSHHYRYDFFNFNRNHLLNSLSKSLIKNDNPKNKHFKFFLRESENPDLTKTKRNQLFDYFSVFDEVELPIKAKSLKPDGIYAKRKEVDLKIASSICHHSEQKKVTVHCNDLLNTIDSFEKKLWQFHWLLSCGIIDVNFSIVHSETEAKVNLYNELPSFDPSYSAYRKWYKYINQMTDFAQKGTHKCDILVLYPSDSFFCGTVTDISELTSTLINSGYDFDFLDFEKFINPKHCVIQDNTLKINNNTYSVLILPGVEVISLDVLLRIYDFYNSGGTVIAIGGLPSKSCNWKKDHEIENISNKIWFKKTNIQSTKFKTNKWGGKGFYQNNMNLLPEILEENKKLLNLFIESEHKNIRTIVRESPQEYYLFFFNISSEDDFKGTIFSKYKGRPFIWNSDEEKADSLFTFSIKDMYMQIPLEIPAKQRTLIILKKGSLKDVPKIINTNINSIEKINVSRNQLKIFGSVTKSGKYSAIFNMHNMVKEAGITIKKILPVLKISNSEWKIRFKDKRFSGTLSDLSHYNRSFFGKIRYRKILVISKEYLSGYKLILDLGKVSDSIEIIINQKSIGMIVAPPYKIDITNHVIVGDNDFIFLVSSNLSNKLSYLSFQQNTGSLIKEIGLMGPVKIVPHKKIQIDF